MGKDFTRPSFPMFPPNINSKDTSKHKSTHTNGKDFYNAAAVPNGFAQYQLKDCHLSLLYTSKTSKFE